MPSISSFLCFQMFDKKYKIQAYTYTAVEQKWLKECNPAFQYCTRYTSLPETFQTYRTGIIKRNEIDWWLFARFHFSVLFPINDSVLTYNVNKAGKNAELNLLIFSSLPCSETRFFN